MEGFFSESVFNNLQNCNKKGKKNHEFPIFGPGYTDAFSNVPF